MKTALKRYIISVLFSLCITLNHIFRFEYLIQFFFRHNIFFNNYVANISIFAKCLFCKMRCFCVANIGAKRSDNSYTSVKMVFTLYGINRKLTYTIFNKDCYAVTKSIERFKKTTECDRFKGI